MKTALRRALLCVLSLLTLPALADDGFGVIRGHVIDSHGWGLVGGMLVTLTAPSLQGEVVVVTDENGFYWAPQLPPGVYQLDYEIEGLSPYRVEDVRVWLNHTRLVNVVLPWEHVYRGGPPRFGSVHCGMRQSSASRPPPPKNRGYGSE
ncbi:carboxypeptidase-like regulatory domain-containing protein [Pyxidicoccus xibeiensis]|uniref:carboxypeptidase-like regulatory domain-containing protein n=1 Tax=Pyxidicoccus xibeiensis TaxID=2906759 RepID=UPI0020A7616B|nr:carboxypeptidase-like regulatory domain-containing protein [Pyxidicoccus xibeiensis]MCP3137284.1 carboxypeptidase-like regulatory domain-containing protein [Pyxidicoccus xibeiensis]